MHKFHINMISKSFSGAGIRTHDFLSHAFWPGFCSLITFSYMGTTDLYGTLYPSLSS